MQRDVYTALAEAKDRGLEEGLKQGIEKGRAEGKRAHIKYLQELLRREVLSHDQLQRLSLPELDDLAARLQAELSATLANGA